MLLTGVVFASLLMLGQAPEVPADDLSTIFSNLKAAEQKKDTEAVLKLAGEVSKSAKAIIAQPAPTDADELATHKSRVDFAKEVDTYADYAVYVSALRAPDAAKRIEIFDILEKQSPKSEYVPQLYSIYVGALAQTGQSAKMYPFAEKAIQRDKTNEDLLVILADGAMARKQWDRAADFGTRLAAVMSGHAKPDGMPVGDWERRRSMLTGRGYWIAGIAYATVNKYPQADKNLRAALPFIKGDANMAAAALFHLGVANYNLSRVTQNRALLNDAVRFSQECAAIPSSYQEQASKNAWAMKQDAGRTR